MTSAFRNIILLTEREEEQRLLGLHLSGLNPALTLQAVTSRAELDAVGAGELKHGRLIGFCTDIVVPGSLIGRLGFGAYNFHPGPPTYPGWAPASFAIYDRAERFGATAHVMAPKIDSGAIVGTNMFAVPAGADQTGLESLAYTAALELFLHFAACLATRPEPLPTIGERWSSDRRCTRQAYADMCRIAPDTRVDELVRRICAFGAGPPGLRPVTTVQGIRYQLSGAME